MASPRLISAKRALRSSSDKLEKSTSGSTGGGGGSPPGGGGGGAPALPLPVQTLLLNTRDGIIQVVIFAIVQIKCCKIKSCLGEIAQNTGNNLSPYILYDEIIYTYWF